MAEANPPLTEKKSSQPPTNTSALPTWTLVVGILAFIFAVSPTLTFFAIIPVAVAIILGIISLAKHLSGKRKAVSGMAVAAMAWPIAIVVSIATIGVAGTGQNIRDLAADTATTSPHSTTEPMIPTASPTPDVDSAAPVLSKEELAALDESPADPTSVVAFRDEPRVVITDSTVTSGLAIDLLATLPVKGRAPKTGYNRTQKFGAAWLDVDSNGCDTRNDILARDLTDKAFFGRCTVTTGTLAGPYTGKTISFVRGATTSLAVQVDHVVALMNAWETGAQQLTDSQRITFANDPMNLLAVDGPTNNRKGAGDAATWLPPQRGYWCEYVARQISVKATYGLWVTKAEGERMHAILTNCPTQLAFTSTFAAAPDPISAQPEAPVPAPRPLVPPTQPVVPVPVAPVAPAPVAPVPVAPVAPAPAPPAPPAAVYYKNCAAARAAGAAPVYASDPGYGKHLDRDGDGIGCE